MFSLLLNFLLHQNANYYLKPTDIISHRPTLFGYHEPHLEGLFELVSKTHNDFLLDIGANVGLSSVICGANFTEIHDKKISYRFNGWLNK